MPAIEDSSSADADELLRAQIALLRAALRQNDELAQALREEQDLRRQECEGLTAENQILRDALAALNAQALERQQPAVLAPTLDPVAPHLPQQRDHAPHPGRRRGARRAGPA